MLGKYKNKLQPLEAQRTRLIQYLLTDCALIQGSYTEILVKCGRPGCHCKLKPAHLVARLGIRNNGIVQNKLVRIEDRQRVSQLVELYKRHKSALQQLAKIHDQQFTLLKKIIGEKNMNYK